jgi:hypothetical protein
MFPFQLEKGGKMQVERFSVHVYGLLCLNPPQIQLLAFQMCTPTGGYNLSLFIQPDSRFGVSQHNIILHGRKQVFVPLDCGVKHIIGGRAHGQG